MTFVYIFPVTSGSYCNDFYAISRITVKIQPFTKGLQKKKTGISLRLRFNRNTRTSTSILAVCPALTRHRINRFFFFFSYSKNSFFFFSFRRSHLRLSVRLCARPETCTIPHEINTEYTRCGMSYSYTCRLPAIRH